jgi:hypothetical protein
VISNSKAHREGDRFMVLRNVAGYRNLIEISYPGLDPAEAEAAAALLERGPALANRGVTVREVRRGAVPRQVILTVGAGAEAEAASLVDWLLGARSDLLGRVRVFLHPYSLPRPLFFELPAEASSARAALLQAARVSQAGAPPAGGRRNLPDGEPAPQPVRPAERQAAGG